jgi:hypothetical protein
VTRLRIWLPWLARWAVAATFAAAAVPKLLEPVAFAADLQGFRAFPHWSINALAATVPILELVAAAAYLHPRTRRAGTWLLGALLGAFIILLASAVLRGIDVACGCFGQDPTARAAGWPEIFRDAALWAAVMLGARRGTPRADAARLPRRSEAC